jgi:hypothetical protein
MDGLGSPEEPLPSLHTRPGARIARSFGKFIDPNGPWYYDPGQGLPVLPEPGASGQLRLY